ncbi:MAG: PQQ-binding-like beta-propeller repeat protein, partial [Chloroflexi bacterium]|nr:PQQ-binding-like beta-propeller repeat protein [Chloroflexota bacterium]
MNFASVKKQIFFYLVGFPCLIGLVLLGRRGETAVTSVSAGSAEWPMVAANPARTSWTPEEVSGQLRPEWYKPFEAFIPPHVQIIAANNTLYISTASGLYAIDSTTGAEKWVYATEFPLGHSPTIDNGVAYVGGLDNKIHAIDANSGTGLWTYSGGGGFETNPLIINNILYAGNRDGKMYAIHTTGANIGELAWSYQTAGPILFSAAHNNGTIYFASNDSFAYALNASTGALVWKSAKLPGAGFYSYWPVVYEDKVIFSG